MRVQEKKRKEKDWQSKEYTEKKSENEKCLITKGRSNAFIGFSP